VHSSVCNTVDTNCNTVDTKERLPESRPSCAVEACVRLVETAAGISPLLSDTKPLGRAGLMPCFPQSGHVLRVPYSTGLRQLEL
jgi:hypothetical protein